MDLLLRTVWARNGSIELFSVLHQSPFSPEWQVEKKSTMPPIASQEKKKSDVLPRGKVEYSKSTGAIVRSFFRPDTGDTLFTIFFYPSTWVTDSILRFVFFPPLRGGGVRFPDGEGCQEHCTVRRVTAQIGRYNMVRPGSGRERETKANSLCTVRPISYEWRASSASPVVGTQPSQRQQQPPEACVGARACASC